MVAAGCGTQVPANDGPWRHPAAALIASFALITGAGRVGAQPPEGGVESGASVEHAARLGLPEGQTHVYLDGVPLELAGYPYGPATLPPGLVDRADVHSGAPPVSFGSTRRGYALDLSSEPSRTRAGASYEQASFGTHRARASVQPVHAPSGMFTRIGGYADTAENDRPVDVKVADERGRLAAVTVPLFNAARRVLGANIEVGVVERPWADRLSFSGFVAGLTEQIPHNARMAVPYGEARYRETRAGGSVRAVHPLGPSFSLDLFAGYQHVRSGFLDVTDCVWDWFGSCVARRLREGEVNGYPSDVTTREHHGFARATLAWRLHPDHRLVVSSAPRHATRQSEDRRLPALGMTAALERRHELSSVVSGVDYHARVLEDRLEGRFFVRHYLEAADISRVRGSGLSSPEERTMTRFGAGAGLRHRLLRYLWASAAYAWTAELLELEQILGDQKLLAPNSELLPQSTRELRASLVTGAEDMLAGGFGAGASAYRRDVHDLVLLQGNDRPRYENIESARGVGVEASARWVSPGGFVALRGLVGHEDLRSTSVPAEPSAEPNLEGERVPKSPYLFAGGGARVTLRGLLVARDELGVSYSVRHEGSYPRTWGRLTLVDETVPAATRHDAGVAYAFGIARGRLGLDAWIENLADAAAFDAFGGQRPRRSFHARLAGEW
jgi:vitamin B12 transporter